MVKVTFEGDATEIASLIAALQEKRLKSDDAEGNSDDLIIEKDKLRMTGFIA